MKFSPKTRDIYGRELMRNPAISTLRGSQVFRLSQQSGAKSLKMRATRFHHPHRIGKLLLNIAKDPNLPHRKYAIRGLAQAAPYQQEIENLLLRYAYDENHPYRGEAIRALGFCAIAKDKVREFLFTVAGDKNHPCQIEAIKALGNASPENQVAKAFLFNIGKDNTDPCQVSAIEALIYNKAVNETEKKELKGSSKLRGTSTPEGLFHGGGEVIFLLTEEELIDHPFLDQVIDAYISAAARYGGHVGNNSMRFIQRAAAQYKEIRQKLIDRARGRGNFSPESMWLLGPSYAQEIKEKDDLFELAARLQAFADRLLTRNGIRIDGLFEGRHRGTEIAARGLDFEHVREAQLGDPQDAIDWNATARMDKFMVRVNRSATSRNIMIVIDPIVFNSKVEDANKKIATLAGMIAAVALKDGEQVGLVVGDNYYIPPSRDKAQLIQFLTAVFNSNATQESVLYPVLSDPIIGKNFIPGSRVVMISDFSNPTEEMKRSLKALRAKKIEVTPIDVGDEVPIYTEPVVVIGGLRMRVNRDLIDLMCRHAAKKRSQRNHDFLKMNKGRKTDLDKVDANKAGLIRTCKMLGQPVEEKEFSGEYTLKGRQEIEVKGKPGPLNFDNPNERAIAQCAAISSVYGYENFFRLFREVLAVDTIGAPLFYIQNVVDHLKDPSFTLQRFKEISLIRLGSAVYGHQDMEKMYWSAGLDSFNKRHPFEEWLPGLENFRCPWTYWAFGPYGKWEFAEFLDKLREASETVKPGRRRTGLLSPEEKIYPQTSVVDAEETDKKAELLAKSNAPLTGMNAYLPVKFALTHDPKTCSYESSDKLKLEGLARGGGKRVKIVFEKFSDALANVLRPVGAKLRSLRKGILSDKKVARVELAGGSSEFIRKVLKLPLFRFRELAPHLFEENLYEEATRPTFSWEEIGPEIRAKWTNLLRHAENMTVEQAITAIQNFVIQNYEYKGYSGPELILFEDLRERAEKGEASGVNEYLGLILSLNGGKCAELAEITLALLRAAGIPAGIFNGYVAKGKKIRNDAHRWAGVILKDPEGRFIAQPVETAVSIVGESQKRQIQEKAKEARKQAEKHKAQGVPPNGNGNLLELESAVLGKEVANIRHLERLWERLSPEEQRLLGYLIEDSEYIQWAEANDIRFGTDPLAPLVRKNLGKRAEDYPSSPPYGFRHALYYSGELFASIASETILEFLAKLPEESRSGYAERFIEALKS